jgi:hypothetical protein
MLAKETRRTKGTVAKVVRARRQFAFLLVLLGKTALGTAVRASLLPFIAFWPPTGGFLNKNPSS